MKFSRVELKEEKTFHRAEHEVFLSFDDDAGAEAFYEWWEEQGAEQFGQFCAQHPDFSHLME